ncbi:MAG TPA: imidazole glycerol phosphate synthase subunit HisH [Ignavibacteriaceae bacterium]|nr:imidazole glycerol phosphate synthase subunit HisH [Ignavibacteriaceae bacterium]
MIALIDYGAGNVASVANALTELKQEFIITSNEAEICRAQKIIFPGVGEASYAIRQLHLLNLFTVLRIVKKPMLGICLGMQLMADFSKEGNVTCLGIFSVTAEKFDESKTKVPHMGWNNIEIVKESKLFKGIKSGERFYFANSYYLPVCPFTTSISNNAINFSSSLEKDNFYGVQFHPEKSGSAGLRILKNFIDI